MTKTVLLTGATGGIGRALISELDKLGYTIIAIGQGKESVEKIGLEYKNVRLTMSCDFNDSSIFKLIDQEVSRLFDQIDILINCAGVGVYQDLKDIEEDTWDLSFSVNVKAPFFLTKYLLPLLEKSDRPIVMNIGSGAGTVGIKGRSLYVATKFALRGFSLSMSKELKDITTTIITLGSVMTNFGNLNIEEKEALQKEGKKYLTPEDVAKSLAEILESDEIKEEYVINP